MQRCLYEYYELTINITAVHLCILALGRVEEIQELIVGLRAFVRIRVALNNALALRRLGLPSP
jgi:hypothetical protein